MSTPSDDKNRFGQEAKTNIPDGAPLASSPGHKLRTSNTIVDRKILAEREKQFANVLPDSKKLDALEDQELEYVEFDGQVGVVRKTAGECEQEAPVPNQFTGPSYRTKKERFRFDGHKMNFHLDRVAAWQRGEKFAPIHIDMGLTKFCNTACIYCYAVVQNMTKGTMIGRDALLKYIEDCGRLGVRSIGFIGDGEPTLNPAVYDATVLAKQLNVDTSMATNGILLDMDRAEDLLRDMSWIRINLSAGTPEGFRSVHQSTEETSTC